MTREARSEAASGGGGAPHPVAVFEELDWERFAAEHWDRGPVLFKNVTPPPFVADEVFEALLEATRPLGPRIMSPSAQLTVGREQQTEPGPLLPGREDGSLAGYGARMTEKLDGGPYALVVNAFHAFDHAQWRRERDFYTGLWHHTGQPLTGAITTLFHGTYSHSPVGVHKDRFATFMYALHGRKRMRFWTHRPWHHPVSTILDYQPYLPTSFTATAEPGDLLYWPATHYHVGESDLTHHPATSIDVGIPRSGHTAADDLQEYLYGAGGHSLLDRPGQGAPSPAHEGATRTRYPLPALLSAAAGATEPQRADALPPSTGHALADLGARVSGAAVRERDAALTLESWTSGGLQPAPPPAAHRPLTDGNVVQAVAEVLWSDAGHIRFAGANGLAARTELTAPELGALVTALGDGPRRAGELAGLAPDRPERVRALLSDLVAFRALRVSA